MTINDATTVDGYEPSPGPLDPQTLETAYKIGIDYHEKGNILAAESHLLLASKGYEETCGLQDSKTLDALEYLGITYRKLVKLNEAEATHNRVVEARTAMSGPDHTATLVAWNRLAMVYRAQGRLDEAEEIYRRVWETLDKTLGSNNEATLRASISLGNIAFNRKNFTEAGDVYASALSRYESLLGPDHPSTQQAASNLAAVRIHQKRYSEAETILLTIVRQITKSQGLKSVRLLPPWLNLSCAYDGQEKYDEAQKTLSSVLSSYEEVYGPSHPKTLGIIRRRAIVLAKQEKLTEAIEIIQKGIDLSSNVDGYADDAQIQLMLSLGRIFDQQGRFSEARQIHHQLSETYENRFGENHDWTISSLQNEAEMIFKQENYTEAELAFQNVTERCKNAFGDEDERTLWSLMGQCHAACGSSKVASVENDIWLLFSKCDEFPSLQNGRAILVFQHLSKNCVTRRKFKEAEALMVKGYEICLKFFDRGHPVTISYGLKVDKVRRQLWQHEKGHSVDISVFPNTQDRTPDAIIDILEFTTALSVKPADESAPLPSRLLANLALSYGEKWEESHDPRYLDIGIDKFETAILVGNEDDEKRHLWLDSLGRFYRNRFQARNTLDDLRKAIEVKEKALGLQDEASPDRPKDLSALSVWLIDLYERDSTLELLDRGIKLGEEVLSLTASDDPRRAIYLNRQGMAFLLLHELNGTVVDLARSFELIEAAMTLTPKTDSRWKLLCSAYADLFRHQFKLNGKIEDLEEAVTRVRGAIHEEPENHILLESLARQLGHRYMTLGKSEDLDEAIEAAERSVELWHQDQENRYQADGLMRLGYLLVDRFEAKGHQEDLDRAIMHLEQARNTPKTNSTAQARCLSGLADAFRSRWRRTADKDSLEAAIDHERLALDLLPDGDVRKLDVMNNLANNLIDRFKDSKSPSDMEEVIKLHELVLSLRPSTHMHYPGSLNNLANALEARFTALRNIEDLNMSIETSEKALSFMHADDPSRAGYSFNLGARHYTRYLENHKEYDLVSAVNHHLNGWRVVNGLPFDRVLAGSQAVYRLRDLGRFDEATTIAMEVVDFLPRVTTRSLQITDQQYVVREFSGIAGNACSLLLRAGRLQDALMYLEKGRTVILDLLMSSRVDLTELESVSPELADRFRELQDEINQTFNTKGMSSRGTEGLLQKRLASVSQFDECVEVIRSLPGQSQFLHGPSFETIRSTAKGGFIIVVNITTTRSDAIVISDDTTDSLELPELSRSRTCEWLEKNLTRKAKDRAGRKRQNEEYTDLLHWLWVSGVKPIFDQIKLQSQSSMVTGKLPRICWIGSGVASMLPFHAACDRTSDLMESTISYAISSYSPSIKTLFQVRAKLSDSALGPNPSLLMVGMPTTRGHAPLSGIEDEIEEITEVVEPSFSVKSLLRPQPAVVLSHLASYDIVHFACHALSDSKNPLNGHLMLESEGAETSGSEKCGALTVETIVKMDLKRARIAYLSACSTAENRATKLLDEAIHLVSGFQVAGFAHVLGTMWPAPDLVSRDVAVWFYQHLARLLTEPGVDNGRAVAEAFHLAVKEVRSEFEDQPLFWAQFVHFGG